MTIAPRDENRIPVAMGVSSIDGETPTVIYANPATGAMLVEGINSGSATWGDITGTLSDQTDLQTALDGKVNDTGDTMTGDLGFTGKGISTADYVKLNTSYTITGSEPAGTIMWNSVEGTTSIKLDSQVTLDLGRELHFYGKASGDIANGDLCQYAGVQGDHILIKKCVPAEVIANPFILIGVATETFTNGNFGRTTWFGKINGVFTTGWTAGDELWFDNVTGQLTNTEPTAPNMRIMVGYVVKAATGASENGIIEIAPEYGKKLADLDDVDGTPTTTTGQILVWNNTAGYWDASDNINNYLTKADFDDIGRFGLLNRSETTISFDGTNTFTLASVGTSWSYWRSGLKYTITGSKSKVLATPMVDSSLYYIYIDATDGTLSADTGGWTLNDTKVPVATVYWNSALTPKFVMTDERHTVGIDRKWHREHHFVEGTKAKSLGTVSGLVAGSSTPGDKTFGITGTQIFDEDLYFAPADLADPDGATPTYYNLYRTAANTYAWAISDMPFKYADLGGGTYGYIEYDNAGTSTPMDTVNRYCNTYIFVSNAVSNTEANPEISTVSTRYFIMQGRGIYTTQTLAEAEQFAVSAGLPVAEGVALYRLTWKNTGIGDTVKGRCQFVSQTTVSSNITTSAAYPVALHNSLAGLDGGTAGEYYHLTSAQHTKVTTSNTLHNVLLGNTTSAPEEVAPGTSGNLLTSNGTTWTSSPAPVSVSVTTKGDLQTFSTVPARLPVGTDGQILESRASETTGIKWINPPTIPTKATAAEVATGTDDSKYTTPLAVAPYANYSMARQAIINGNFDVWQRGITGAPIPSDSVQTYICDRWLDIGDDDGGTRPTLTRTKETLTAGDIPNSYYFTRLTTNGAGSSFGAGSYHTFRQNIENGCRLLCGDGKKVTVSFWARSDIANKRLGIYLQNTYGTGGSPTSAETINGTNWTLTSSWTKYTCTFTTNTLAGKTFGTNNDDTLRPCFFYQWDTTYDERVGASTSESYVGAGYIDIAQVQLCAGDVALSFQPKSYVQELSDCQRYCYVAGGDSAYEFIGGCFANSTSSIMAIINLPTTMRIEPTLESTAGTWQSFDASDATGITVNSDYSSSRTAVVAFSGMSGLTTGHATPIRAKNSTAARITLTAEL